ncbi:MAG: AmmeMemoRadiSam system protein A [Anaerolineaceae bacterium]|nr:AmmeMemoRadiSam system protein A [Anaerolineaceae bacterium]
MPEKLSQLDQQQLLSVARAAVEATANNQPLPQIDLDQYSQILKDEGASFVTLMLDGKLRGCIGTLEAYQPLILDVQSRAVQAASKDPRFSPVRPEETARIKIEISRLTQPVPLEYDHPKDLVTLLRPGVDGVVISEGHRRATFLPQVWDDLPEPKQFIAQLCRKMGCSPGYWEHKLLEVETYQVEEFSE